MKYLPVLSLGMVLSVCSMHASLTLAQDAEPPKQQETLRERREREALERHANKLAELQQPIRKVHAMIDAGDLKTAFKGAGEIRRRLGEPKQFQVEVLFVRLALADSKPELALEMIKPFVGLRDTYEASEFDPHYYHALAKMQLAMVPTKSQRETIKQPGNGPAFFGIPLDRETDTPDLEAVQQAGLREALVVFDWLAGNAKGLNQIHAAAGAAKTLALLGDYGQAITAYQFAIHQARHPNMDEYFDSETDSRGKLLRELQAALNEVRRMQEIKRYSLEYFLYREGDRAQRHKGDYKRAIELYDTAIQVADRNRQDQLDALIAERIPALKEGEKLTPRQQLDRAETIVTLTEELKPQVPVSPFADASKLNRLKCMFEIGRGRFAIKELEAFIAEDELGLYRGEALMILSTLALDEMNFEVALKWLEKLDTWVVNARAESADWDFNDLLPGIRAAAKKVTDAPRQETTVDFWGNVKEQPIAVGQLVNRKTCPWYLDDLEERGAKYLGFIALMKGDGEAALKQFKRIIALDPNAKDGDLSTAPNDFTRLKFGCENGYLTTFPQDLEKLTKQQQAAMLYGDFLYVTQEFDRAIGVYQSVLDGRSGRLKPGREDCVYQAIGMCHLRKGSQAKAIEYWEKSLKDSHGTWSEYRSAYAIALVTRNAADEKLRKRGRQLLQALADSKKGNQFTQQARITLAMDWAKEDRVDDAKKLLGTFKEEDGQFYALAQYLIQHDGRLVVPKAIKPENREAGEENGRKWERIQIPGPAKGEQGERQGVQDKDQPQAPQDQPEEPAQGTTPPSKPKNDNGEQEEDDIPDFFGIPTD